MLTAAAAWEGIIPYSPRRWGYQEQGALGHQDSNSTSRLREQGAGSLQTAYLPLAMFCPIP